MIVGIRGFAQRFWSDLTPDMQVPFSLLVLMLGLAPALMALAAVAMAGTPPLQRAGGAISRMALMVGMALLLGLARATRGTPRIQVPIFTCYRLLYIGAASKPRAMAARFETKRGNECSIGLQAQIHSTRF